MAGLFEEILNSIGERTKKYSQPTDEDYIKDGLLHCGNCHTPKQAKITFGGSEKLMPCVCKCAKEKWQKEQNKKNF